MKFDIFGRFVLEVVREHGRWVAYRPGQGTRRRDPLVSIPDHLPESALTGYLDDLFHEYGRPGADIVRIRDGREVPEADAGGGPSTR